MSSEFPEFDHEAIANLAKRLYGIEGEVSSLDSFEDQNARIRTSGGSYVLKIANKRWTRDELELQTHALEHLATTAPDIICPRVVATKTGAAITVVDGYVVRLLTYLEGRILGSAARSLELNHDIGRFMGRFAEAMQSFAHPGVERPNDPWNLDKVLACRVHLEDVSDEEDRRRIERFYDRYRAVSPKLRHLRKSVIHADANENNFLVAADRPAKIIGIIDFGDLQLATHINDLAITLAYALLGEDDIESAARQIIQGYTEVFALERGELEVLFDLMAMRLVQSVILSSHSAKGRPDNNYILSSRAPALILLEKLEHHEWR